MPLNIPTDRSLEIESFITKWMSNYHIPGAALTITSEHGNSSFKTFGARSLTNNKQVTKNTLFGIGSCTKSITALGIMQLAEQDHVSLSDPVNEYIPHLLTAPGPPISIAELLTHSSGIPSDEVVRPLAVRPILGGHAEAPLTSEKDFRRHVRGGCELRIVDDDEFRYYNTGYILLGKVIEAVSGQTYEEYIAEHILTPLGMNHSTFLSEEFESSADRMTPYFRLETETVQAEFPFRNLFYACGGLITSPVDISRYLCMYMDQGNVEGTTVLTSPSTNRMCRPHSLFGRRFDGAKVAYGLGLSIEPFLDQTLIGHGGTIGVSNAWFGFLEESRTAVAIMCTTEPEVDAAAAGKSILAILQGKQPRTAVPQLRLADHLEKVTGAYTTYRGLGSATVERVGGTLRIKCESTDGAYREELLIPDQINDDCLICSTVMDSGLRRRVRFRYEDRIELLFGRSRFWKETLTSSSCSPNT